jgi:predicted MPP superfamily phosphohydrolase
LLLSHTSEIYEKISSSREVLALSGDTHGGQVRLPGWFWRLTRLTPDPAHIYGIFREGKKALIVTRGLGTSRVHFRLGEPPELVVLEFK